MKSGMIYLYYKDGERAAAKRYNYKADREKIIEAWKKNYGKRYENCYLQIAPDTTSGINDDGKNKSIRHVKNKADNFRTKGMKYEKISY